MSDTKQYLGDGVYVEVDTFGNLVLTTEDGTNVTNRIVLEAQVMVNFQEYIEWVIKKMEEKNNE